MTDEEAEKLEAEREAQLAACKAKALRFLDQGDMAGALVAFIAEATKPYGSGRAPLIALETAATSPLTMVARLYLENYRALLADLGVSEETIVAEGKPIRAFDQDMRRWIEGWR